MLRFYIVSLFLSLSLTSMAGTELLLHELDTTIAQRAQYIREKEGRINNLKDKLAKERDNTAVLKIIDDLYNEYHVFKFDSAMYYADWGLTLANMHGNAYYTKLFTIYRAEILAIGGLYSEATECLAPLDTRDMERQMLFKFYMVISKVYSYWSSYSQNTPFAEVYWQKTMDYFEKGLAYLDKDNPLYDYYQGEYYSYLNHDAMKARQYYQTVIKKESDSSRIYAMTSYALANNYLNYEHDEDKYEEHLIRAALADLRSCTMEAVALQILATRLFEKGESEVERAERYISVSMEDAKFYNNRLRILEISRILPQITTTYQARVEKQNHRLRYSIIFISLLVVAILFTTYLILRQNRKLKVHRRQLADSNERQAELNTQLHELNQRLVDTNKRREGLASIYIDLCAKYIDKLGKYQTLVKRKIKANQTQELLQIISSTRISEEDAATFLTRFDKAFLELYPTFVDEFNALLHVSGRIQQKSPHTLTTELRTFALIRLGVKNTADIAGLLFLSNQTIYNCRSVIKNKAINKESFDDDVMHLCTVIKENQRDSKER